jgi:hypothetical protein
MALTAGPGKKSAEHLKGLLGLIIDEDSDGDSDDGSDRDRSSASRGCCYSDSAWSFADNRSAAMSAHDLGIGGMLVIIIMKLLTSLTRTAMRYCREAASQIRTSTVLVALYSIAIVRSSS